MAFRFVAFVSFLAYVNAGNLQLGTPLAYAAAPAHLAYAAPIAKTVVAQPEEYDPHPQYSYGYDIQDALTGDSKSQSETRDGDVVQGRYSLVDPDGTRRTVEYTADSINGFNAVVHREPLTAPVVTKVAAPVAYATPIAKVAAPIAYAAPAAYASHSAPIAYAAAPTVARVSYSSPIVSYQL